MVQDRRVRARKTVHRIIFLARFAPLAENEDPSIDPEWGNSPIYHHRLYQALKATGAEIVPSRDAEDILRMREKLDFVYSIYNRAPFRNSEIFVSSLCEFSGLAHLGGNPNTRAIAEDKHLTKLIAAHLGISTPAWIKIDPWDGLDRHVALPLPCIIKWRYGADSAMLNANCIAFDRQTAISCIQDFQRRDIPVIVEKFIEGTNLTVGVLGETSCRIGQTIRIDTDEPHNLQTYDHKKFGRGTRTKSHFQVSSATNQIENIAKLMYGELSPLDYFRLDFRYRDTDGALYLLEVNAVCNLHPQSSFAVSCESMFGSYNSMIKGILEISLNRQALAFE